MKLKHIIKTVFLTMIFLAIGITISNAGYSASNPTVKSGEKVTITVTSSTALEAYNLDLESNGGLTFNSCSKAKDTDGDIISINGSSIGYMSTSGKATKLGTYTFTAPAVTEKKTYTVKFKVDQSTTVTSTVTVEPVKTQTNTNTGSNSGSNTTTQKPQEEPKKEEVKKGTIDTFYINGIKVKQYLNVTNKDSVSIKVNTSTKEGATVYNSATKKSYKLKSGASTNIQIVEGTNTLTITLDTGHKETRKIYSQKEEVVEPNVIEEKKEEVKVLLKSLAIKAVKDEEEKVDVSLTPEFSSEVYEYNILLDEDLADVTKLDIQAVPTSDDFKVEITGNDELKVGHNTVTITVKSKDEKTTTTYKIIVAKLAKVVPVVAEPVEEVQQEQEVVKPIWNREQQILITVFTTIIAIMGIAYAIIEYRYKKEPETKIPNSGTTLEEDMNGEIEQDKIDEIPFVKVGFEKEDTDKIDILKDEGQPEFKDLNSDKNEIEEPKKPTKRRGKHF